MSEEEWSLEDSQASIRHGWIIFQGTLYISKTIWKTDHAQSTKLLWEEIKSKIDTCPLHRKAYLLLIKRQLLTGKAPYE